MSVSLVYETHATTIDNERGVSTGWLPGELSPAGRDAAVELGRRRRDDGVAAVYASDLRRAVQTVEIAFAGSALPIRYDPRLRECDYGTMSGSPAVVLHPQRLARVDEPFPGGESYRQVAARVRSFLVDLLDGHDGDRVLVIGHAATRFSLDHLLLGIPLDEVVTAHFAWQPGWEYVVRADALMAP